MKPTKRRHTFEEIHEALFPRPPQPRTVAEMREGVRRYIRKKHGRMAQRRRGS